MDWCYWVEWKLIEVFQSFYFLSFSRIYTARQEPHPKEDIYSNLLALLPAVLNYVFVIFTPLLSSKCFILQYNFN